MSRTRIYRRPRPDDQFPTWAIFVPMPIPGQPDSVGDASFPNPVPTTPDASRLDAPAPTAEASKPSEPSPSEATQAPVESSTVQVEAPLPTENPSAPRRFDLERIPTQARPLLEEFAQGMGDDLLAVSPVGCHWQDCQFPATVLIKSAQNVQGELVRRLVWGCPKCGREYRPKAVSAKTFERIEGALFREHHGSTEAPETDAADAPAPTERPAAPTPGEGFLSVWLSIPITSRIYAFDRRDRLCYGPDCYLWTFEQSPVWYYQAETPLPPLRRQGEHYYVDTKAVMELAQSHNTRKE